MERIRYFIVLRSAPLATKLPGNPIEIVEVLQLDDSVKVGQEGHIPDIGSVLILSELTEYTVETLRENFRRHIGPDPGIIKARRIAEVSVAA